MEQARNILRLAAFLMLAVLVGMGFMAKRYASQGKRGGNFARYQNRSSNEEAWQIFDSLRQPDRARFLGTVCGWSPPGIDCPRALLPSDPLQHVLTTFRDPQTRTESSSTDPVKAWATVVQAEQDLPLAERIESNATLAEAIVLWNLLAKERQERRSADSVVRALTPPQTPAPPAQAPAVEAQTPPSI